MIDAAEFVGGNPSLDFVNTIGGIRSGTHDDKLASYEDLLSWAVMSGTLAPARRAALAALARKQPRVAESALTNAKAIRESMHAVFLALVHGKSPPRTDLAAMNASIGDVMAHARIHRHGDDYEWGWDDAVTLDAPLWPVLRAAGDLLVSGRTARLRECASESCGWLFLDTSKNHSRRWCDMKGCGNRAKVRRYRGVD
ncbi:MAG: CGNR zinc finger domain-containing protein [Rhizomicrobium sp.]